MSDETASIEQVEIIPENRARRYIISKGKCGQRSEGSGRKNKMDCGFDRKRRFWREGSSKSSQMGKGLFERPLNRPFKSITLDTVWKPI